MPDPTMHIGYVLREFPRLSETFISNEILELERQGVQITIFALRRPPTEPVHLSASRIQAPVIYLKDDEPGNWWRALFRRTARCGPGLRMLAEDGPGAVKSFLRGAVIAAAARRAGVRHLHAHYAAIPSTVARAAHALSGIPFSFTAHAFDIFLGSVNQDRLRRKIAAARFVVTVTEFNRSYLIDRCGAVAAERVRVIHNGIDLEYFSPEPAGSQDSGLSQSREEGELILAVGRLVPKKGFDILLRACARLKDTGIAFRCRIVGDGPERAALESLRSELGIDSCIDFAGPRNQDTVLAWMREAAVICLPCRRDAAGNQDALPTVLLEALACGLPVVSTTLSGIPEIISSGTDGLLVPPEDAGALADSLEKILASPELRQRLASAGRRKAEQKFDLRKNVDDLRTLFEESVVSAGDR